MDISSLIGIVAGVAFMVYGILQNGSLWNFYDYPSIFIVLGGTLASVMLHYPLRVIFTFPKLMSMVFFPKVKNPREGIDKVVELSYIARREGLLALEEAAVNIDDPFLQKGILLVVDGAEPDAIRSIMETELSFMEERHKECRGMLESAASYAPAFGMIGTLIGLINMLKYLSEPDKLGPSMAVALVTTFYGSILANMVFLPMAGKLNNYSQQEVLYKEVLLEGILSIHAGENPRLIEEKLAAFLSPKSRQQAHDSKQEAAYNAQAE